MKLPMVSDFCGCFSLRTGTIVISIAEFMGSMFCMFLLLLCNGHAREMAAKLEADIMEDAEREGIVIDGDESSDDFISLSGSTTTINVIRFNHAKTLVGVITLGLLLGLIFYTACCIASLLLFIGATLRNRAFIFSWLSVSGLCILIFHTVIIAVILTSRSQLRLIMAFFIFIAFCILSYCFVVVRSYFLFLQTVKENQTRDAVAIKLHSDSEYQIFDV